MSFYHHQNIQIKSGRVTRRNFLKYVSAGSILAGSLGIRDLVSLQAEELRKNKKAMILLWMRGGPSQFETFDPKPGTATAGETEAISTSVPGIQIAQGWNQTAKVMDDIAIIRSMTNKEGNHQRATYQLHTGHVPLGALKYPTLGSSLAKELADPLNDLPACVSVGRTRIGAGFLGVEFDPFIVQNPGSLPSNVSNIVTGKRLNRRLGLMNKLEKEFAYQGGRDIVEDHKQLYKKASKMVLSPHVKAFDIASEPESLKKAYGDSKFGKGCLMARRLIEAGVSFVEVELANWDHHNDIFNRSSTIINEADPAMATLITDLKQRGMLDDTLIVWMGEFGRTPKLTGDSGRGHYPKVFNAAIAGGGIKGGQVIGSSTDDGSAVKDRPVKVNDLFCSICHSLKVDPRTENDSPLGRPLPIVDEGEMVKELFS